jgi:hypothetical protein
MYRHKVIKNVKLIKAWIKLKLIIVLGLMKLRHLALIFVKIFFFVSLKYFMRYNFGIYFYIFLRTHIL